MTFNISKAVRSDAPAVAPIFDLAAAAGHFPGFGALSFNVFERAIDQGSLGLISRGHKTIHRVEVLSAAKDIGAGLAVNRWDPVAQPDVVEAWLLAVRSSIDAKE